MRRQKILIGALALGLVFFVCSLCPAARDAQAEYTIGADDILEITVSRPEQIQQVVTVAPDGAISFPYIGVIHVDGLSLNQIQQLIVDRLTDGFMKYPVVTVSLQQSLSRKFFVYGEVLKPGHYLLDESTTVLKAITIAGGFSKFGSASRVKVLRDKEDELGYDMINVNIKNIMSGKTDEDLLLKPGDIVVVSEGIF
jgi:polysaccharide biosynthesis/export protein